MAEKTARNPDREMAEPELPAWAQAIQLAWENLFAANEALAAVNLTGSRAYSREGMRVLERRAKEFLNALDAAQEAVSE